jgi:hypothetical protein
MKHNYFIKGKLHVMHILFLLCFLSLSMYTHAQRKMENLDRGLVAVQTGNGVFLSWRMLGTDPKSISFNIYRNGTKVNASPVTGATNMIDAAGFASATYTVRPIVGGAEQAVGGTALVWGSQVRTITLSNRPSTSHTPNDINVGDLDGDGQYELVVKWYPSNAKDNSQSGVTANTYLAAYKMNGTFLWIIDLGRNIRSGAHYTQHLVGDYDSDGFAEVACKTAPGTRDGIGNYLSSGPAASDNDATSYVNSGGYILSGPEYLTIFNGRTGKEMATVNYPVPRGNVGSWGDTYGNRVDRFNSTNAYLDGVKPSMIFQRGYYTRLTAAAMDWNGSTLSTRWIFDSNNTGSTAARGQGNHSVMAADIDGDGFDEVLTGSTCIDHDGRLKWTTGFGHGDANHVGDFDPNSPGLEVWQVSENKGSEPDHYMIRASDGRVLWRNGSGNDNGRGMIADIDARYPGQEAWSAAVAGTYQANGTQFTTSKPSSMNFRVYWDGDLQDELPNGSSNNTNNRIDKWNGNGTSSISTLTGLTCNSTKATPNIVADLLGDWREEIILHDGANRLYIHTTTIPTQHKMYTLMHDPAYRNAISYQQSSYNQPPHLGFWLGAGIDKVPTPNIVLVGQAPVNKAPTAAITAPVNNASYTAPASVTINATAADTDGTVSKVDFYNGTTLIGTDVSAPYSFNWINIAAGTYSITVRATDNAGATGTSTAVAITVAAAPAGLKLQGETACTFDGILNESINAGFNGTGYLNLNNVTGSAATWVVNSVAAKTATLSVRYANASANNRNVAVRVNGILQTATLVFPSTGAWTTWQNAAVQINLVAGRNTLTFTSLVSEGAPNIDELNIAASDVTSASCTPPNVAPVVSITAPLTGSSFVTPTSFVITASASDADGTVSKVDFYNGTVLLGTVVSAPYSFTWNNVAAGNYTLTARASDNSGAVTTSAAVTVSVTTPVVSVIQGEAACTVDGILNESINAGFRGTGYANTDNASGSSVSWNVYSPVNQTASLTIRYANASALNRAASLSVGGNVEVANIAFVSTGAWTTWNTVTVAVNLKAGNNTLELTALTADGCANIDELSFTSASALTSAGCASSALRQASQVIVAPNPSTDIFSVTVQETAVSVSVMDMNGTVVFVQSDVAAGTVLELGRTLPIGMYTVVTVFKNGTVETNKIQKL